MEATTLYIIPGLGTDAYEINEVSLRAGTRVKLISDREVPFPGQPDTMLREVKVYGGPGGTIRFVGWLPTAVLEQALPEMPYVIADDPRGINVRAGDSVDHPLIGSLRPEEMAIIQGINPSGSWYFIRMDDGREGWVWQGGVIVIGSTENVPVRVAPPAPTRTPTATPSPATPPP